MNAEAPAHAEDRSGAGAPDGTGAESAPPEGWSRRFPSLCRTVLVLDGTELHRDWFLSGPDFRLLGTYVRDRALTVCVPAPVVTETVANYVRAVGDLQQRARALGKDASRLRAGPVGQLEGVPYRDVLLRALEALDFAVLPSPIADHETIVDRAASRTPPFDSEGSGYRDTLTWLSVLDLAARGSSVVLVSKDRDFQGPGGGLAPALAREAQAAHADVELASDVGAWLRRVTPDGLNIRAAAADGRDDQLLAYIVSSDFLTEMWLPVEQVGIPPGIALERQVMGADLERWRRVTDAVRRDEHFVVTYELDLVAEIPVRVSPADADRNGWQHDGIARGGLVELDARVPFTMTLEVTYTEHDILEDISIIDGEGSVELKDHHLYPAEPSPGQLELDLDL